MNYKGFDKDLKCMGFQYEVGKEYEESEKGFHAHECPLDVFYYYPPADSRYCEVEQSGELSKDGVDSKVTSSKIKIGAEIGLSGLIGAGVKFILEKVDFKNSKEYNTGYRSAATNTGYRSAATNTGDCSAATNTGDCSAATNTGNQSAATNTGDCSAATNTGYRSAATVEGKDSVAISIGYQSKAKASLGSAIVVVERGEWNGNTYPLKAICSAIVDGEKIKADTFYTVKDGVFVEAE